MSAIPPEVAGVLDRFDQALAAIENKVKPFVKEPVKDVLPKLEPIEAAKMNLVYSYSINSLYYMLLKVQGEETKTHPVRSELNRVQKFMMRTIEAEKASQKSDKTASEPDAEDPSTSPSEANLAVGKKRQNQEDDKTSQPATKASKKSKDGSPKQSQESEMQTPKRKSSSGKATSAKKSKKKSKSTTKKSKSRH